MDSRQRRSCPALAAAALLGLLLAGCDPSTGIRRGPPRGTGPLIQTDALEYDLIADAGGLSASIPYVFENRTGERVFIPNCHGGFQIHLVRLEGSVWVWAWVQATLLCQSAPITLDVGERFSRTLRVWGSLPGTNVSPQFDVADPAGTYRLVWDAGRLGPGGPVLPFDDRVSNEFVLRGP